MKISEKQVLQLIDIVSQLTNGFSCNSCEKLTSTPNDYIRNLLNEINNQQSEELKDI